MAMLTQGPAGPRRTNGRETAPHAAGYPRGVTELGIGLLGCGRIAQRIHLDVLLGLRGVRLVAVAESDDEARAKALARAPGAMGVAGTRDLLDIPDVEAVVVCLPNHLHAETGTSVLAADRHLYLEKPLALTAAEGDSVIDAWRSSGRVGAIGFNLRANPIYTTARRSIAAGAIGRVVGVRSAFCSVARALPPWKQHRRTGGGALLDLAGHHADLIPWMLGDEVTEVTATVDSLVSDEDTATLTYRLGSGVRVQTFTSISAGDQDRIEVIGDSGRVVLDRYRAPNIEFLGGRRSASKAALLGDGLGLLARTPARLAGTVRPAPETSFVTALQRFADAARGLDHPVADLADGERSLRIILAAEESARSGRTVSLPAGAAP